jgi:hypothetical protein
MMLYQFLLNSLTEQANLTMLSDQETFTVAGQPDGVVFLKLIIGRTSIDTNAKVNMIRENIANLKHAMRDDYKGNVRDFNTYVANLREELVQ